MGRKDFSIVSPLLALWETAFIHSFTGLARLSKYQESPAPLRLHRCHFRGCHPLSCCHNLQFSHVAVGLAGCLPVPRHLSPTHRPAVAVASAWNAFCTRTLLASLSAHMQQFRYFITSLSPTGQNVHLCLFPAVLLHAHEDGDL